MSRPAPPSAQDVSLRVYPGGNDLFTPESAVPTESGERTWSNFSPASFQNPLDSERGIGIRKAWSSLFLESPRSCEQF